MFNNIRKIKPANKFLSAGNFLVESYFLVYEIYYFVGAQTDLRHSVAVAQGNGAVFKRIEIDCYAERRAYFVLTAVALAYRTRLVVRAGECLAKLVGCECR